MWDQDTPIAEGATAQLFAYGEGRVLKLYRSGYPFEEATNEAEKARIAQQRTESVLRTPIVREVGEYEGRPGVVFDRIEGESMLIPLLTGDREFHRFAPQLAILQATLHTCSGEGLPAQKDRLQWQCQRSSIRPEYRQRALSLLADLPEGDSLCHGDFHPGNVLLTKDGAVVIDWVDAVSGNPLADVARTVLLMLTASVPIPSGLTARRLWSARRRFVQVFLNQYAALYQQKNQSDIDLAQFVQWLYVVTVARYGESGRDSAERRRLHLLLKRLPPSLENKDGFLQQPPFLFSF